MVRVFARIDIMAAAGTYELTNKNGHEDQLLLQAKGLFAAENSPAAAFANFGSQPQIYPKTNRLATI